MIKVKMTNCEVIPAKKGSNETLIVRASTKANSQTKVVNFQVKTRDKDTPDCKKFHYKNCTIFAKNDDELKLVRNTVQLGAILQIDGSVTSFKSPKDEKYYENIVVESYIHVAGTNTENVGNDDLPSDDDCPF